MKILTLFSRFGIEKYPDSHIELMNTLEKKLPNSKIDLLIIDTSLPENYRSVENSIQVIGAPNHNWEFGAWDHALKFLGNRIHKYDYVHIVTSACHCAYTDFHHLINENMLETFRTHPVALGHLEVYNTPVSLFDTKFQTWLKSSYIFIPTSEVLMLKKFTCIEDESEFFTSDPCSPFKDDAPMSENYKNYIHSWLTSPEGTGQGTSWHTRMDLDATNIEFYNKKAKAILNEMSLSFRLRALGGFLVDITWLHHAQLNNENLFPVPGWYHQIINRKTGHEFIIEG